MSITLFGDSAHLFSQEQKFEIQLGLYPDNTPVVNFEDAWNTAGGKFRAILVRPNSMQEFFTAMMIVDSIRERGGTVNSLVLPCVPGQRQDRLKWEGDMLTTLKFVAKTINGMNFKRVVSLDPHSLAAEVLIDRLVVPELALNYLIERAWDSKGQHAPTYDAIIAPDAGAAKRAEQVGKEFELPVYHATKHRDPATNKLSGFAAPDDLPANTHVLVVDDLCDAGGTFLGLAEALADNSTAADLFVTHGLFSKGTERLAKAYGTVYATDSIDRLQERVNYFKISEGLVTYA